MGKARILSRVGRGLYTVEPIYDTAGRDSRLAELSAEVTQIEMELAQLESRIASLNSVITGRLSFVDSLLQELRDAVATELERADKAKQIEAIRLDMASSFDLFSDREAEATGAYQQMIAELDGEIADMDGAAGFATALRARIDEVMAGLAPLSRELGQARHDAAMLHVRRANNLQQRDALLAAAPPSAVEAWCADYSTQLPIGAEVATIEVPGEPTEVLIYPQAQGEGAHHAPRDGIVAMRSWQTPEQAYLNAALLPGWQRHRPTYRFGILVNLDREHNLCDVKLSPFDRSSAQGLRINPGEPLQQWVLRNVPITYMQCHGKAFNEGDEVVVRFLDQDWNRPVVIGFRRSPRRCYSLPTRFFLTGLYDGVHDHPPITKRISSFPSLSRFVAIAVWVGPWSTLSPYTPTIGPLLQGGGYPPPSRSPLFFPNDGTKYGGTMRGATTYFCLGCKGARYPLPSLFASIPDSYGVSVPHITAVVTPTISGDLPPFPNPYTHNGVLTSYSLVSSYDVSYLADWRVIEASDSILVYEREPSVFGSVSGVTLESLIARGALPEFVEGALRVRNEGYPETYTFLPVHAFPDALIVDKNEHYSLGLQGLHVLWRIEIDGEGEGE